MSNASLVVLAAGMGSRYGGLKQIDPMGPSGEIVIEYAAFDAIRAGFDHIVFVIRKDIEADFREMIGKRLEPKIAIDYAFQDLNDLPESFTSPSERVKPWGTGHAIYAARNAVKNPFAVINADDFYGQSAYQLMADHLKTADAQTYAMVAFELFNTLSDHGTVSRGVCTVDENNHLIDVIERLSIEKDGENARFKLNDKWQSLTGNTPVSLNFWGFSPLLFEQLERLFVDFLSKDLHTPKSEFFIPSVVDTLIKEGEAKVKVMSSADSWFGVTYPEDKDHVKASIQDLIDAGKYPQQL